MKHIIFIVLSFCISCNTNFDDTCYEPKKQLVGKNQIIREIVSNNFKKSEEVFVIEKFAPTHHSALFFSIYNRNQSLKFNFYNNRIDQLNKNEIGVIEKIDINNFMKLMRSDNNYDLGISKATFFYCYNFKNSILSGEFSNVNYGMSDSLMTENNFKEISDILNTYGDKRKPCESRVSH